MLQNASTISATHDELAHEGQTEANLNDPVNHHFVAFVEHNGELYELDGRKSFPISHGKTSSETLLEVKLANNYTYIRIHFSNSN